MIFRQIIHDDLGCASYLIGDEGAGAAAVVDPKREIDEYLALSRYMGVQIEAILETHNHADHVSGHGPLSAASGAPIYVHHEAAVDYEHVALDDGEEIELGSLRVRALHTPGHRPEHTAFLLIDAARGPEPWAVLSGDSLFVGDIARPDLAVEPTEGARGIFRSLHGKLLSLPDETEIWPGHLGGSLCGGPGMDMKVCSTIGFERDHNEMLREDDEERFVERAIAGLAPQPPNFEAIVELNRGPLPVAGVEALPLAPRQVALARDGGALVVDVRTSFQFDEAHVPGAVAITALTAGFGSRLAWIADRDQEIVLVGRDDEDARRAVRLAEAVGIRRFAGYLHGGMTAWREEGRAVERIERIDVPGLRELSERDPGMQILDVRDRGEWDRRHIPGSVHTPYYEISAVPDGVDAERPIAVICSSGQRGAVGASLLRRHGARRVLHVVGGGVGTWAAGGWPIEA
jgi:glyoxylase-like metal-dependent hydrolase (beta-lactamase superfamily II)/rhodanese-related sulfurtransferase